MPSHVHVEVLVSDNASTDNTAAVVKAEIEKGLLNLVYYRNPVNLGFDGNIFEIYRRAQGQYVWFMGDDDHIEPGGIKALVGHLLRVEPCGVVVNNVRGGACDGDYTDLIPHSPVGQKIRLRLGKRVKIATERERLAIVIQVGQISTCVVRKYGEDVRVGPGGGHMHERLANLSLLKNPHYYFVPEPVIGGGPTYWSHWFMEAVMFGIRELYAEPDMGFSRELVDLVSTQTCKTGLRLLRMRYWRPLKVDYPEIDEEMIIKLKRAYKDAYALIEPDVLMAVRARKHKKRDRLVFLIIRPFYFGYKAWQLLVLPKLKHWSSLLRLRLAFVPTRSKQILKRNKQRNKCRERNRMTIK